MNDLVVFLGLISFPGLIASIICESLLVLRNRWDAFKYIKYTFVMGLGSYFSLQVLIWVLSFGCFGLLGISGERLKFWSSIKAGGGVNFYEVFWATLVAVFISLVVVKAVNGKWLNRIASGAGISNKFGDENLYSFFLNSPDVGWIYVRDASRGLTYFGYVSAFSERDGFQELVMVNVDVYTYEDSILLYSVDSLYICKTSGVLVFECPKEAV